MAYKHDLPPDINGITGESKFHKAEPKALRTPQGFRAWRRERKLSQIELASLLDVTNTTVHRWETGQRPIPRTVELALLYLALARAA